MAEPDWSRPHWSRNEARAMLLYFVFGVFATELKLDLSAHASRGLPSGVEMRRVPRAMLAHWDGHPLRGALGDILCEVDATAFEAARKAPECLMLRGELADSASFQYLGDTLGVIAAVLDAGGVTVVDPQILEIHSAADWRKRYAGDAVASPRNHVAVLCNDDTPGHVDQWIHTRGMRKFARPDISIRRVPQAGVQQAGALAAQLVDLQARGMRFGDGSIVDAQGLPEGLRITRAGSLEDPAFNNTHLEVRWNAANPQD